MRKTSRLEREALRMQAGKRHRGLKVELRGSALEIWEALEHSAAKKGIEPDGLVTLLILHGHIQVDKALASLQDPAMDLQ